MSYRPSQRTRGRAVLLSPRGIAATIGSLSAAVAFLAAAGSAQATSTAALTAGPRPAVGQPATIPQGAVRLGAEPGSRVLHLDVVLEPRDPAALSRYATQVATPGSPMFHDYLPRGVFPRVFGPTESSIATVRATLSALGLKLGRTSPSRLSVPVTGSAATVERAFGTKLATYRLAGRVGFANVSAPRLPAAAAPYVQAVFGLDSLLRMQPLLTKPTSATVGKVAGTSPGPAAATGAPQPCRSAKSAQASIYRKSNHQAWVLTPNQMAEDYEFSPLYKSGDFGRGQTVAIVELGEPNLPSDITAYQRCYGTHAKVSYLNIDHFRQRGAGEGEAALDIETVIAMAPKANVIVYRGPSSNQGWYDTFAAAAFDDLAKVESVSYGLCEAIFPHSLEKALNVVYEEEAVQGQTVVISSGDTGSEGCLRVEAHRPALLSAEFPASDPNVLSVGGTSIVSPKPRPRQEEVVWNDHFDQDGAGGGGLSTFWAEPSYQRSSFTTPRSVRAVADVSADADPETGYLIAWKGGWLQVGGTSAAAPLWAALLTLTNNKCSGSTIGFVTPLMYYVASKHVKAVVLNDIIQRSAFPGNDNNDYTGDGGGNYPELTGYDLATGLGTPLGGALAKQLCRFSVDPKGYWLATADGQVYNFHAPFHGSLGGKHLASKVVGIAGDPHTNGYWLVTAKGAVTGFHAPGRGSAHNPSSPVVGIAASPTGRGYWVVTAKGHVYAFGVPNHGSVSGHLASPVVGIAADVVTGGYWVVTRGGKVYPFDAASPTGKHLSKVTGIAATPTGQAYWLVTTTGKVAGYGVTAPIGMPIGNRFGAVIGIAGDRFTNGYYLATSTGIVGAIDAGVHGSHPLQSRKDPIVGIATTH